MGGGDGGDRCRSWNYQRTRRHDVGPDSGILRDVARPPPKSLALHRASTLWHTVLRHNCHGHWRRYTRGLDSDRRCSRYDEHRHSLCLCPGLYRCGGVALYKTKSAAPIQTAVHASCSNCWSVGLPRVNELSSMGNLGSICNLDCYRCCGLSRLRHEAQQTRRSLPERPPSKTFSL